MQEANVATAFLAIPGFQSYRPQSGQIFGILKQMKADFQKSLDEAQKAEAKSKKEFEALEAAKEKEIAAAKKAVMEMDAQLELDRTFLANLKEKCAMSGQEFDKRVEDRMAEIAAVQDTIKILNSDEAFDNFDKTVGANLLQTSKASTAAFTAERRRRQRAAAVL